MAGRYDRASSIWRNRKIRIWICVNNGRRTFPLKSDSSNKAGNIYTYFRFFCSIVTRLDGNRIRNRRDWFASVDKIEFFWCEGSRSFVRWWLAVDRQPDAEGVDWSGWIIQRTVVANWDFKKSVWVDGAWMTCLQWFLLNNKITLLKYPLEESNWHSEPIMYIYTSRIEGAYVIL